MSPLKYKKKFDLVGSGVPVALDFSSDGELLASASGRLVQLWDTETGNVKYNFVGKFPIRSLLWGPKKTLYCGLESGYVVIIVVDDELKVWVLFFNTPEMFFESSRRNYDRLASRPQKCLSTIWSFTPLQTDSPSQQTTRSASGLSAPPQVRLVTPAV